MGALLGIFASFGLMLSAIGLYGAISYSVGQRTHEIGLRMALGASRQKIFRVILSEGLRLAVSGTALGALATIGARPLGWRQEKIGKEMRLLIRTSLPPEYVGSVFRPSERFHELNLT